MWVEGGGALFQTAIESGPVVIDRGRMQFRPDAAAQDAPVAA